MIAPGMETASLKVNASVIQVMEEMIAQEQPALVIVLVKATVIWVFAFATSAILEMLVKSSTVPTCVHSMVCVME